MTKAATTIKDRADRPDYYRAKGGPVAGMSFYLPLAGGVSTLPETINYPEYPGRYVRRLWDDEEFYEWEEDVA